VSQNALFPHPDPLQRLLYRFWPSQRLNMDPLGDHQVGQRYFPVTIANWKLISPIACLLLARRVPQTLEFRSDARLTIVIPFRDREAHLRQLLPPLTAKLAEQAIRYRILIVEQEAGRAFNRGKLINVGFVHAQATTDYYCIHDVDAIPVEANYRCPSQPLRLVTRLLSTNRPESICPTHYFSGAVSVLKEQVLAVNGFSNEYWGWGKEDDEFLFRLQLAGYLCYFDSQGAYHDLPNPGEQQVVRPATRPPPHVRMNRARRSRLLRGLIDPGEDGISTLRYELLASEDCGTHERIRVRI
jgi:N-terminal region of glycosyl transferase group 7/N-terminal domain of galactosyltransferase